MHHVLYLHGFASGPASTKARFFVSRLRTLGFTVDVPDLNGNSFSDMTLTTQLDICRCLIGKHNDQKFILIGSSMGGLLATLLSQEFQQVSALILLAPGFGLNRRWRELLHADEFDTWREAGTMQVFHHGAGKSVPLKFQFIIDAESYQTDNLRVSVPTLVLHGIGDEVVPVGESESFQRQNEGIVDLHRLDSDHALTDCLDDLWSYTLEFLKRQLLVH